MYLFYLYYTLMSKHYANLVLGFCTIYATVSYITAQFFFFYLIMNSCNLLIQFPDNY